MATTAPTLPSNAQQVIAALHALSTPTAANGDRSVQLAANEWLTSFQHSVRRRSLSCDAELPSIQKLTETPLTLFIVQKDAWETCHVLLFDDHVGLDVKMFAGQTFRAKVRPSSSCTAPS